MYAISKAHPEYEWTCLVRNSDKGALVAKQYPKVRLVYGDLDSSEIIAEEAEKADIVCSEYSPHSFNIFNCQAFFPPPSEMEMREIPCKRTRRETSQPNTL